MQCWVSSLLTDPSVSDWLPGRLLACVALCKPLSLILLPDSVPCNFLLSVVHLHKALAVLQGDLEAEGWGQEMHHHSNQYVPNKRTSSSFLLFGQTTTMSIRHKSGLYWREEEICSLLCYIHSKPCVCKTHQDILTYNVCSIIRWQNLSWVQCQQ